MGALSAGYCPWIYVKGHAKGLSMGARISFKGQRPAQAGIGEETADITI
jgi:hypothetical protein